VEEKEEEKGYAGEPCNTESVRERRHVSFREF